MAKKIKFTGNVRPVPPRVAAEVFKATTAAAVETAATTAAKSRPRSSRGLAVETR